MVADRDTGPEISAPVNRTESADLRTRRRFLKWLIRIGSGAFVLAFAMPALALKTLTRESQAVAEGDRFVFATGNQAGSLVAVDEVAAGTAIQVFPEGKTEDQNNLIQLIHLERESDQPVVAYSAICTHLGCSVLAQLNGQGNIVCPCHASVFNPANGAEVVSGPAGRPLPALPIRVEDDGAIVAAGTFDAPIGPQ
jgi:rieske iron-sulfur protein